MSQQNNPALLYKPTNPIATKHEPFKSLDKATPHYLAGFFAAFGTEHRNPAITVPSIPAKQNFGATGRSDTVSVAGELETREEQIKKLLHPLDAFPRLLECVQENRPPDVEDQFRFQWFGLFYQGPQHDAFLLRVRLPGGRLKPFQLSGLAEITQASAGGHLLLNGQGGIDVPGVPMRAAAGVLRQIEGIGLSACQTGGDCVQAICGGEHEGLEEDDPPPSIYPLICELEQALLHHRTLSNLPRHCEIIFRADGQSLIQAREWQRHAIILQALPKQKARSGMFPEPEPPARFLFIAPGCDGGGFALTAAQVVSACLALLGAWAKHGDRTDRQRAGLAEFCAGLGREPVGALLGKTLWQPAEALLNKNEAASARELPTGLVVPRRRLLSGQLARMAEVAQERKLNGIRLANGQIYFIRSATDVNAAQAFGEVMALP